MIITYLLYFILSVLLIKFYLERRKGQKIFKKMGIPGPSPNFLFGNLLALWGQTGFHCMYQIWTKLYGRTFGYFEGPSPVLVTSDPDILQEVFVKQFHNFYARKVWPVQVDPETDEKVHMFFAMGDRWRRLRSVVSPAFSSNKMRRVRDETEPFLTNCRGVIKDTTKQPILYLCGFIFPALQRLWIGIYYFLHYIKFNPVFWLEKRLGLLIENRKRDHKPHKSDLLQLLIEARMDGAIASTFTNEIVQQALLFLLAGYETTSTTLSFVFHELANNFDIQNKLREEINTYYPNQDDVPTYDDVRQLKYLDMVIKETLRKYPLASVIIARKCTNTCVVKGITIPKGMVVQADVWSLHKDKAIWGDDVETFDPERFSDENSKSRHPYAWIPFGAGPRMCAGLRFAVLEAKMATATMVKKFAFKPSKDHRLEMIEGATVTPKHGVLLHATPI
ncbi:cytochrome P450 3A12 [Patella vulgata]|uniref:cytochrome P450 3A12 n=1 Tax=Patella vulgata TaxID=6465 RepID=UPI002180249A|nr:cytochrome P450 3A12 [Patella vulgata]